MENSSGTKSAEFQSVVEELVAFFTNQELQEQLFWQIEIASVERNREGDEPNSPVVRRFDAFSKLILDEPLDDDDKAFLVELLQFPHRFSTFSPVTAQHKNGRFRGELLVAMTMAREFGLRPFRNEASAETSACDAVAVAFKTIGFKPTSYSGVKAIYLKNAWNANTEASLTSNKSVD